MDAKTEAYLRKHPWVVVELFLHEKYGDCMGDRTAAELEQRLAVFGHSLVSGADAASVDRKEKS